jgi:predicted RecA/RadA family phage recombinase
MAMNEYHKEAESLRYPVDAAVESGDFIVVGGLRGVALVDAKEGDDGDFYTTISHRGVYIGETADAVDIGDAIYLADAETFGTDLTTDDDSAANALVGYAFRGKDAGAGPVYVRVNN